MRMLQVPELRQAMGLPQSVKLNHGARRDRIRIMGNEVCAPVMRRVASDLITRQTERSTER